MFWCSCSSVASVSAAPSAQQQRYAAGLHRFIEHHQRSASDNLKLQGDYLTSVVKKEGCEKGWEYVIVEDIEKEGAFDEAIKGVDAVEHTASPFHFRVTDPFADLINPAVQGTLGLLRALPTHTPFLSVLPHRCERLTRETAGSAAKEPKVKRVVITSSFAAVVEPHEPVYEYSEKDWNETSPRMVEEKGKETDPFHAYRASKTLAERAAWDFVDKEKPGFDLATINPPFVIGPLLHEVPSADKLNTSVAMFYGFLTGDKKAEDAQGGSGSMTDVRDVAHCHIEALVRPDASMKRFCVATQSFTWQMCLDAVHATKDDDLVSKTFPNAVVGNTGAPEPKQNKISTAQARKVFEWQPIPLEKTA